MATRNVVLSPELDSFVDETVASGEFSNASEVMRAALREMREKRVANDAWLAYMRRQATEGFAAFDRGEGIVITDTKAFMRDIGARVEARRRDRA